jgi:hypothetical protein
LQLMFGVLLINYRETRAMTERGLRGTARRG